MKLLRSTNSFYCWEELCPEATVQSACAVPAAAHSLGLIVLAAVPEHRDAQCWEYIMLWPKLGINKPKSRKDMTRSKQADLDFLIFLTL